ncbi:hypothetical protein [Ruminococcus sp. HUN007]|uniref:hypothetical protein n=1 Tax=Ruminococcus sp. HUN007 TaxID=1514668 RepID=UPI0005D15689|nr:hypothetical protein [Ruminococcus sp. HUN007]
MDIKRSNRIKKAAAIAALVLVVGGASVAAETGNAGLFEKDIISADAVDTTVVPISTADDFIAFLSRNPEPGKTLTAKLTASIEVPGGYDKLKKGMIIYGNGNTITVTGVKTGNGRNARTDKKPLFKTIEEGAKIENVAIQADEINHDDARGVLCNINRGEIRYVDVNANVTAKKDNTGIICGENHGKIFGCAVTGKLNVEGRTNAGGICGTNHTDGIIERCSCEEEITFNDDAETVGGLCGLNSGKIYDCVFKGMLPIETTSAPRGAVDVCPEYGYAKEVEKWVWVEDAWFGHVEKVTVKKYYADLCNRANHSAREIGGLCGKMDDIGTIANTLYNGQRHVTKTGIDYIETHKDEADSNYEYKVVNGYECIGKCEKEENMANCFRIDTYKYDTNGDGNEDGTHFSLIHYHFNKYDSNHTPRKDYEYTDGTVVNELNAGNGLVGEEHTNVWVQGKDMPELNRSAGVVSYTAPTKLNRTYDDTTKPLVKAGKVDAGAEPDAFLYTLTPNVENSWSESIPEAKDAGQYRVYYKVVVEEGSRYTFVPIDNGYVDVTISPAELTVTWPDEKDRTFSYDEKNHSVVPTVSGYQGDDADLVKFTTTGDTVNVGKFTVKAELDSAKQDSKNYILTDEGCECEITKVQATAPKIKELKATYGDTLEKVALPTNSKGVFEWKDSKETLVGNVGKHTFKVIYTPNDTNYLPVELDATVYVSQKKIKLQWTGKHEYTYGDEIKITADSSDIFSYDRPDTKVTVTIPEERNASETEYVAKASVNNGNYEIDGDEFKYKIKKATPSYSEALEFTVPYGTKLGDIDLPDVDGGKLSWVNNDYVGDVTGETGRSFDVMFVPDNQTNYTVKTLKATVNVTPKEIEVEWTGDTEYSYGTAVNLTADKKNEDDILAEDESNGVEISVTGNTETAVGEYTATATINSGNYTITNSTCPYSIVKAKPSVQITETVSAVYGQKLGELDLPTVANGTLSWKDEDKEVLVGDKGEHVVEVTFTPDESASYETVTANVTVVVAAKKIKLQWTGEHEYTYGDEIKITADSSDIFDYDRTNETKTQVSVTIPEGRNASETEYVATASINNENYTIEDNEFKYRINKATLAYSEPLYLDAVYGQKVSELPLREVTDGKYEWVNAEEYVGDVTKEGERNTRKLIFKPADTVNFNELEVDALIKVTPKEIEVEWTGDTEYYYGTEVNLTAEKKNEDDILAEDESNGVEISVTGNTETAVGEYTATATINSGNYTITNPTRPYSIIKAKPSVQITETVSAIYGQQLGELTLPTVANGTLSWKDEDKEVLVGDKGEHVVEVTFTPDESASYETVTANVTVVVAAKKIKLQWTGEHEYTYGDEIKITADSSDIFDYDRTNETKTQVSVTIPEGRNASETEYVATASINNENYTIEDNEF